MVYSVLKYYLIHYTFVLYTVSYAYFIGEDSNTIVFITLLSLFFSTLVFLLDSIITILFVKLIFKTPSILAFLSPIPFLFIIIPLILNYLDFYSTSYYFFIPIIVSVLVNLFTWSRIKSIYGISENSE